MKQIQKPIDEETATFAKVAAFLLAYMKRRKTILSEKPQGEREHHGKSHDP